MTTTMAAHRAHRPPAPRFTPAPPPVPRDPAAPGQSWPGRWPLRSYLELAALDTAPGSARGHAIAVLWEWKLDAIEDEAALIVSELVTNAILAASTAPPPVPIRLWMLGDLGTSALFLVWDATEPAPVRRATALDAEHGRGLTLVEALSATWGYYHPAERPYGKVVWAFLPAAPVASGDPAAPFIPQPPYAPVKEAPARTAPTETGELPGTRKPGRQNNA